MSARATAAPADFFPFANAIPMEKDLHYQTVKRAFELGRDTEAADKPDSVFLRYG